jgi:pimeloyl-ACP methyl ester carboxylesterase
MPFADVNGQRLHYEDTGPAPNGNPDDVIVFSHGLYMDHSMFDPQVEVLRDRWRCITWDERAHGETDSTDEPFTYWDSANDVLGLLDHLGVDRAVLAGMSQGGYLSLRAALTAPERVRALVLIDTQSGVEDPANREAYDQMLEIWTNATDGPPQELLDIVGAIILGDWDGTGEWHEKWRQAPPARIRQAYDTLVGREDDVTSRLGELTMPAIVIHGDSDAAIGEPSAAALADALSSELHLIEGAGHAANLTHPVPVNQKISAFLDNL